MPNTNRALKQYLLLCCIIFIWGISWPITKIALHTIPPIGFTAFRLLIGTVCMFVVVTALGKLVLPKKRDIPIILFIGLIQMALFMTLINLGLQYVNAGRSAILVYTTPIWVMPLAILFFHEKITPLKWTGFILGLLGILTLFSPFGIDWTDHSVLLGNGILLLAAFSWAISILAARNMKWHRSPLELVAWQLLIGTIPVLWIALQHHSLTHIQWNPIAISALIFVGVLGTSFAYWGTLVLSKEIPSTTLSLSYLAVPVTGLIFSAWLLKEPITGTIILAMIFILSGIACVALSGKFKKKMEIRVD